MGVAVVVRTEMRNSYSNQSHPDESEHEGRQRVRSLSYLGVHILGGIEDAFKINHDRCSFREQSYQADVGRKAGICLLRGARYRIRTCDPLNVNEMLYQLS